MRKLGGMIGILLAAGVSAAADVHPARTLKLDAVELVAGREVPGMEPFALNHGRHRYLFATDSNRATFQKDPAKYEIQFGGACARMGALSGQGSPEIHAVHNGRIFLFASESCRKTFLAGPEKLLDQPDPRPQPQDPKAAQQGRQLIEHALKGFGGAEKIDALTSYRAEVNRSEKHGDKVYQNRTAWTIRFPGDFRKDDDWDAAKWAAVATASDAFFKTDEIYAMHAQQRSALEREFHRNPLVILRNRNRPDFVALAAGAGQCNGTPVEFVAVSFADTTTRLGIDPQSGRCLCTEYVGHGPNFFLGELQIVFSDFRSVDGLDLPAGQSVTFAGKREPGMDLSFSTQAVNEPLEPGRFLRP